MRSLVLLPRCRRQLIRITPPRRQKSPLRMCLGAFLNAMVPTQCLLHLTQQRSPLRSRMPFPKQHKSLPAQTATQFCIPIGFPTKYFHLVTPLRRANFAHPAGHHTHHDPPQEIPRIGNLPQPNRGIAHSFPCVDAFQNPVHRIRPANPLRSTSNALTFYPQRLAAINVIPRPQWDRTHS